MANAFTTAQRCFALARSTTFAGEREAAIARGGAIAEKAGLDLDLFDIPGRPKAARSKSPEHFKFEGSGQYTREELTEIMRAFNAHMSEHGFSRDAFASYAISYDRAAAAACARDGETVYEARRRSFDEAIRAADARDRARGTGVK